MREEKQMQYAKALEDRKIAPVREHWLGYINGELAESASGEWFETTNPATGERLGLVSRFGAIDVGRAVAGAQRGMREWQAMKPDARGEVLYRVSRILQERAREFAVLETLDNGKTIRETRDIDVVLAAEWFFSHAGWADKLEWTMVRNAQPVGVVGAVIPWNFPLLMAAWKIAPALAAGCAVVLKPAETTPLTALLLADVLHEAGVPAGCVQILPGFGELGETLCRHQGIEKIAFTGSTRVGKQLRSIAGTRPITLELGGKGANIIYRDADIEQAVEGIVWGIFMNQGHVCCAGSRVLVEESIQDEVLIRLSQRVQKIRVGDPLDKNSDMGAINSRHQLDVVRSYVDSARSEGVHIIQGEAPENGCFFPPTVLTNVEPTSQAFQEEIFGPVVSMSTFRTADEAVQMANHTRYGLAAGVWTQDGARAMWTASKLKAGVVWENTYNLFDPTAPFGGVRESGWGREGGRVGMNAYLKEGTGQADVAMGTEGAK